MITKYVVIGISYEKDVAMIAIEKLQGELAGLEVVELAPGDRLVKLTDVLDAITAMRRDTGM